MTDQQDETSSNVEVLAEVTCSGGITLPPIGAGG